MIIKPSNTFRMGFGGGGGGLVSGEAVVASLIALDVSKRAELVVGLGADMVGPGEVWMTKDDGSGLEGLTLAIEDVATQQDILAGADTDKVVTAESIGGIDLVRTIPYAAVVDIDFSGPTPVWSRENKIFCTGALAIQASTFSDYMEGKEFSIRCIRSSGAGGTSVQNKAGGASVEYRTGLSAADFPALGATAGDSVTIRAKVMSASVWRIEAFEWKTA